MTDFDFIVSADIVKDDRHFKYFRMDSNTPIVESQARMVQQKKFGYHPGGYGFYGFNTRFDPKNKVFVAEWKCAASCD